MNKVNAQTIGPVSVSKHLKLSQKDSAKIVVGSPSTLSVDSGNTNEQERLAEFDEDSTEGNTTEDDQVDPSSSATSVCSRSVVIMCCSVCLVSMLVSHSNGQPTVGTHGTKHRTGGQPGFVAWE